MADRNIANLFEIKIYPSRNLLVYDSRMVILSIPNNGEVKDYYQDVSYMTIKGESSVILHEDQAIVLYKALKEHLETIGKLE